MYKYKYNTTLSKGTWHRDVTDLHEEASDQRSADVGVVISAVELSAPPRQAEAVHDPGQLLADVVCRHQWAVVDEIIIAPLSGLMVCVRQVIFMVTAKKTEWNSSVWCEGQLTLFKGVVDVEQCHVVPVDVGKAHLGLVSHLLSLRGSDEALWD